MYFVIDFFFEKAALEIMESCFFHFLKTFIAWQRWQNLRRYLNSQIGTMRNFSVDYQIYSIQSYQ